MWVPEYLFRWGWAFPFNYFAHSAGLIGAALCEKGLSLLLRLGLRGGDWSGWISTDPPSTGHWRLKREPERKTRNMLCVIPCVQAASFFQKEATFPISKTQVMLMMSFLMVCCFAQVFPRNSTKGVGDFNLTDNTDCNFEQVHLSVPQFPQFYTGGNTSTCLLGLLGGSRGLIMWSPGSCVGA